MVDCCFALDLTLFTAGSLSGLIWFDCLLICVHHLSYNATLFSTTSQALMMHSSDFDCDWMTIYERKSHECCTLAP